MTELFTATFNNEETREGRVGGDYFYWQEPRAGNTIYVTSAVKVSDLTDLQPMRLVKADAVVIEGAEVFPRFADAIEYCIEALGVKL